MRIKEFGKLLFSLRVSKNLSLLEASRESGVDRYLLDRIERGILRSFPRHKTLSNLSDFYGFDFQYIPEQLLIINVPSPLPSFEEEKREEIEKSVETMSITMKDGERILIKRALEQSEYNRESAAIILQMSERTLYRKIKEYNLVEYNQEKE